MPFDLTYINDILQATVRMAAPLMLVGIGGVFTERTGVFNIGMEGMMLTGALVATIGSDMTGSVWVGMILAMLAGGLLAAIHAYLTVTRRADQIVAGAAMNLLAIGGTDLLFARFFTGVRTRVTLFPVLAPEGLRNIPILGPIIFSQSVIVWLAFLLPVIAAWILYRTSWGLNIRAVGDHPHAVATAGISVFRLKYVGVILSGVFAGLGGCALALGNLGYFAPGMTGGRGFIVLAALVVGKWNPIWVAAACLLFGGADALQLRIQTQQAAIPYQFLIMAPYILTILALAGFVGRTVPPKTAGKPYDPTNY
jgi:general nucleoside transport system permease protein